MGTFQELGDIKAGLVPMAALILGIVFLILVCKVKRVISISFQMKGKKISFLPVLLVLITELVISSIFIRGCYVLYSTYELERNVEEMRSVVSKEKTVIHAAGTYKDGDAVYTYSNSKEALDNCYNSGNRIAELDFVWTSDGKLVCGHDEDDGWCYGIDSRSALSEEEFMKSKLFGALTTMSTDDLAEFLQEHENLLIVTDIKDENILGCRYIADNYPDLKDRFIVQIYHMDEYDAIKDIGFKYMIYTLYRTEPDERKPDKLVSDIKSHDLVGITFWYDWIETKDIYSYIKDMGVPIFVHTVNNQAEIEDCISKDLLIYTDNTDNEWLR